MVFFSVSHYGRIIHLCLENTHTLHGRLFSVGFQLIEIQSLLVVKSQYPITQGWQVLDSCVFYRGKNLVKNIPSEIDFGLVLDTYNYQALSKLCVISQSIAKLKTTTDYYIGHQGEHLLCLVSKACFKFLT